MEKKILLEMANKAEELRGLVNSSELLTSEGIQRYWKDYGDGVSIVHLDDWALSGGLRETKYPKMTASIMLQRRNENESIIAVVIAPLNNGLATVVADEGTTFIFSEGELIPVIGVEKLIDSDDVIPIVHMYGQKKKRRWRFVAKLIEKLCALGIAVDNNMGPATVIYEFFQFCRMTDKGVILKARLAAVFEPCTNDAKDEGVPFVLSKIPGFSVITMSGEPLYEGSGDAKKVEGSFCPTHCVSSYCASPFRELLWKMLGLMQREIRNIEMDIPKGEEDPRLLQLIRDLEDFKIK